VENVTDILEGGHFCKP